ncbi:MAG: hypothetical protein HSCHL_1060 [Hydrogenibacillus schlegelii]|uniref:Uncharacterized protein n=1 Tax=Hydrogenibacillus schlegelii TaxID=1484 RepID=A0A2T5GCI7_HYDSH|nr:MAG: hypothetical protein HSCHL_1060 [Hydrogenibacillus schlegelii]
MEPDESPAKGRPGSICRFAREGIHRVRKHLPGGGARLDPTTTARRGPPVLSALPAASVPFEGRDRKRIGRHAAFLCGFFVLTRFINFPHDPGNPDRAQKPPAGPAAWHSPMRGEA